MAKVTTQEAKGGLLGLLRRMGFTSSPNVIVFAPEDALTMARVKSFPRRADLTIHVDGTALNVTELHENTRGLRGAKDIYGTGIVNGERHRFYLVYRGDGTFVDGYLQKIVPATPGKIILEERDR